MSSLFICVYFSRYEIQMLYPILSLWVWTRIWKEHFCTFLPHFSPFVKMKWKIGRTEIFWPIHWLKYTTNDQEKNIHPIFFATPKENKRWWTEFLIDGCWAKNCLYFINCVNITVKKACDLETIYTQSLFCRKVNFCETFSYFNHFLNCSTIFHSGLVYFDQRL